MSRIDPGSSAEVASGATNSVVGMAALAVMLAGVACTGQQVTGSDASGCTEGRTVACSCPYGKTGVQACRSDRTWGPCECPSWTDGGDSDPTITPTDTQSTDSAPDVAADGGVDSTDTNAHVRKPPAGAINVTNKGARPDGSTVDPVVESIDACNKTLYFPPGRYGIEDYEFCKGEVWFGVDATLVVEDFGGTLFQLKSGSALDGFNLDYSANSDSAPLILMDGAGWGLKNLVFRGTDASGDHVYLAPSVPSGATGRISCVYLHEGNAESDEAQNGKPLWTNSIEGELILDGVWAEMWAENTLYMSNTPGRITVKNSFFRNTNVGIRVTEPASFVNTAFVHTGKQPGQIRDDGCCGGRAQRGVWWNAEKGAFGGDVKVVDSLFYYTHEAGAASGIDATDGSGGELIVKDSKFHNTTGAANIRSEGHTVDIRNTCMTGSQKVSIQGTVKNRQITSNCTVQLRSPIPPPPPEGETPRCTVGRYNVPKSF